MKKILVLLLSLNIFLTPAFCFIEDDFVNKSLDKDLKIKKYQPPEIIDDFVNQKLDKNLKIKKYSYSPIIDNFAINNPNRNQTLSKKIELNEIIPPLNKNNIIKKNYNILSEDKQTIKVKIKENYTTKNKLDEGDFIEFVTLEDIKIKNNFYPKNSIVKARLETISQNKIWGVPSDVIVGNFSIDNHKLFGNIEKTGANRALWLYPTVYLTVGFFGLGLLLIPIRGGHAKIKTKEIYTLETN